jgi:uncharacterized phage protein (TIGR01671 family)
MREILFRGKRLDNGEWVEGYYVCIGGKYHYILSGQLSITSGYPDFIKYEVDPATVGQFTGLKDKNGERIFEGDVVRQTFVKTVVTVAEDWGNDEYDDLYGEDVGAVVILPSKGVCIKNPVIHRETNGEVTEHGVVARMYKPVCSCRCEVIGNIHDNPELWEATV